MGKKLAILIIVSFLLPILTLGQSQQRFLPPKTLKDAEESPSKRIIEGLSRIKEKVLLIWRGMGNWIKKNLWRDSSFWQKIWAIFEIFEKEIGERLEKEKEEVKKEVKEKIIPRVPQSFWKKFKKSK